MQLENPNGTATAHRQIVMQHSLVGWQDVGEPPTLHFEFQAAYFDGGFKPMANNAAH
nr:hypothetical protein [uncultured Kingella sp.]